MTNVTIDTRRIWLGCLACYNDGKLIGTWLDPSEGASWSCPINKTHDEYQTFDHEGYPPATGEMSVTQAIELDAVITTLEDHAARHNISLDTIYAYNDNLDIPLTEIAEDFNKFLEDFAGEWTSVQEYADWLGHEVGLCMCQTGNNPLGSSSCYFDAAKFARDLEAGDIWTHHVHNGMIAIFHNS